jgi:aspartyl-tRNA(Asn)/glutamyl-tRNA(Gln) amidotransferase subunit A
MTLRDDITELTLLELSQHIRAGSVTSRAATEACLAAIDAVDPLINAFLAVDAEAALAAADAADREIASGQWRGPLHGVPLAHKDMFYRKGQISTGGSLLLAEKPADRTAALLERLDAAGAITVGRLNMAEFAAGPTGQNDHYGACRNPWKIDHISGGSSSGSGAAVAARLVYGSIGSDTGGSIRLPAGLCGITGLKTTYGRISRYGAMPRCWTLDVFGPLARDAADCAVLLEAIAGRDLRDSTTLDVPVPRYRDSFPRDLAGVTIGVPDNYFYPELEASVRPVHEAALAMLQDLGATLRFLPIPDPDPLYKLTNLINKAEAAALHARWLKERPEQYALSTSARIEAGFHIPATAYIEALNLRPKILRGFVASVFEGGCDALYVPVLTGSVPTIAETTISASGDAPVIIDKVTRCTRWVSYLGLPGASFLCGFAEGLPVAGQLIGRPFAEGALLGIVNAYQGVTAWHRRTPGVRTAAAA